YCVGLAVASLIFTFLGFVPDRAVVLLVLGALPFIALVLPARHVPQASSRFGAQLCGVLNTSLQFIAGVSGPLLDVFFIRSNMDRRTVVATHAACQTISPLAKLIYFSRALGEEGSMEVMLVAVVVASAIMGTSLSKFVLERMSDNQFRRWTQTILLVIGVVY